jgi:DNA-directed RNA polymerase alpha subunit
MSNEIVFLEDYRNRKKKSKDLIPHNERDELRRDLRNAIEPYNFSVRTNNALLRSCWHYNWPKSIEEIHQADDNELLAIRNFGLKSLEEVRKKIGPQPL